MSNKETSANINDILDMEAEDAKAPVKVSLVLNKAQSDMVDAIKGFEAKIAESDGKLRQSFSESLTLRIESGKKLVAFEASIKKAVSGKKNPFHHKTVTAFMNAEAQDLFGL